MSYFTYTDLISSFLDLKLVDRGSILIHVGAYGYKVLDHSLLCMGRFCVKPTECCCLKPVHSVIGTSPPNL